MHLEFPDPTPLNTLTHAQYNTIEECLEDATNRGRTYFVYQTTVYLVLGKDYKDTGLKYVQGKFYKEF